jgi:hypothetical protein
MVDVHTHWKVRLDPHLTVKDVREKLAKKIDKKYKVNELYQVVGKKSTFC